MSRRQETRFNGMAADPPDDPEYDYRCGNCCCAGNDHGDGDAGSACTSCSECDGYDPDFDDPIIYEPDPDEQGDRERGG